MNKQPNIILIVIDTLRADSSVDKISRKPVFKAISDNVSDWNIFYNCIAPSSWTIPSHASIFTGVYPSRNGVIEDINHKIPDYSFLFNAYPGETLTEYLKEQGYNTYSFCQNGLIGKDSAFMRGMDTIVYSKNSFQETYNQMHVTLNKIYDTWGSSPKEAMKKSIRNKDTLSLIKEFYGLKRDSRKLEQMDMKKKGAVELLRNLYNTKLTSPFYLFINLMEMHDPHDKFSFSIGWQDTVFGNNLFKKNDIYKLKQAYSGALLEVDTFLIGLIALLKGKNVYDDTEIIITSDHGQSLFENNYFGHCNFLYDSIVKVPLFIKLPKNRKIDIQEGYQSSTKIFQFIKQGLEANEFYDSITSEVVFSECNGFFDPIVKKYRNSDNYKELYDKYNVPTKAVFKGSYKLIYDFDKLKIVEFEKNGINVKPEELPREVDSMLNDLSVFADLSL